MFHAQRNSIKIAYQHKARLLCKIYIQQQYTKTFQAKITGARPDCIRKIKLNKYRDIRLVPDSDIYLSEFSGMRSSSSHHC